MLVTNPLLAVVAAAALAASLPRAAHAEQPPGYFAITTRPTRAALHSLHLFRDGSLVYSDAYGIHRTLRPPADSTLHEVETLLSVPAQEASCVRRLFGTCLEWSAAVYRPKPLAVDPSTEAIYLADAEQQRLQRYDESTRRFVTVATGIGAPTSLTADGRGGLYFNDPAGCRVRRFHQGAIATVAGTGVCGLPIASVPADSTPLPSVRAIAFHGTTGQLFIADDRTGVVWRVDPSGDLTVIAGTGTPGRGGEDTPALQTPLNGPAGLAFDTAGNLYLSEAASHRVRIIDPGGTIRTIAGTGAPGHTGDYRLAHSAQLTSPGCLATTSTGALLVCDSDRIRKLIPPAPGRWIGQVLNFGDGAARVGAGSWVTWLGDFPGLPTLDWSKDIAPDGTLPKQLAGVRAAIDGRACVIAYVSPDRVDLLLLPDVQPPWGPAWPMATLTLPGGIVFARPLYFALADPGFLTAVNHGWLIPAALSPDGEWITADRPAHPGQTITLYVTGVDLPGPITPPYDVNQPDGMQLVVAGRGYPVSQARPFSPGVAELTVQLPDHLPAGLHSVRLVHRGFLSLAPTFLPIGSRSETRD